ncbi:MAG: type VI secretion system tube protein TssD [Myxococcales bacterium]|jgi:type VI secretion system Hcp family effector
MSGRVYLELSSDEGPLEGESTVESIGGIDVSKMIECEWYSDGVTAAQDPASRTPTGQRIHDPISVRKWVDKSSPELQKALCHTQPVEGTFYFFRPSRGGGQNEHFFSVRIADGRVSKIKRFLPEAEGDVTAAGKPPMEEVSFVFGTCTWTHVPGGKEHEDSWAQQG